jgi:N-acetylglucosamine-6-phosphate deacetylase
VDIHIHGAFGIDFMTASTAEVRELSGHLRSQGYEGWLPTTITASAEAVKSALARLPNDDPMILGIHLEGPFLSPSFPGAQPPSAIREPHDLEEWEPILSDPRLKVITMAPELPGALDLIRRLSRAGVIVSMGHSNATYEEANLGFNAGARHATHTYNAMRGLHHREPGLLGYVFNQPGIQAELVYDRFHVRPPAAEILLKMKGAEGVMAVSDSSAATGLPEGTVVEMWGLKAVKGAVDVRLLGTDTLAGSAITLLDAFRNLAADFGPEVATRLCCLNPRRALGMGGAKVWLTFDLRGELVEIEG